MIHSITCDQPDFKNIKFNSGFNVVIAERTEQSTDKDSRNGTGKSTLIEILHFCLGGNLGETLSKPEVSNWTFNLQIDLGGKQFSVSRNTSNASKVIIEGDCSTWPIKPELDPKIGKRVMKNSDWKNVLGVLMFGLPLESNLPYSPTFRSLISYFARKNGQSGAFQSPFLHYSKQTEWDKQSNNAFLLGLGWELASKWQVIKERKKVVKQFQEEADSGLISSMLGSSGELDAYKKILEDQVLQEQQQLDNFKVLPQYSELEQSINQLTKQIHENVNQNVSDKRLIEIYEESIKEEVDVEPKKIEDLFEEAGLIFNQPITRLLTDAQSFHKKIVINRRAYLQIQTEKLNQKIEKRTQENEKLTNLRAERMSILKTHGALEEWTLLQNNHQNTIANLKDITLRLENIKKFEQGKSSVKIDQELLLQEAEIDTDERKPQIDAAILTFNSFSKRLYNVPGFLSIDLTETGFKFNISIKREGSHGISNMKIFCYDMLLAKLWAKKDKNQLFLVHDSLLFDGVDERQKALALQLALEECQKESYQYICTMNSDAVPRNDLKALNFDIDKYIIAAFTDATESGGLLGKRF
jgi:uncharacterized protein YydD (DUF2326 family)